MFQIKPYSGTGSEAMFKVDSDQLSLSIPSDYIDGFLNQWYEWVPQYKYSNDTRPFSALVFDPSNGTSYLTDANTRTSDRILVLNGPIPKYERYNLVEFYDPISSEIELGIVDDYNRTTDQYTVVFAEKCAPKIRVNATLGPLTAESTILSFSTGEMAGLLYDRVDVPNKLIRRGSEDVKCFETYCELVDDNLSNHYPEKTILSYGSGKTKKYFQIHNGCPLGINI